ncbi:MAG TPA: DUF4236 domain-containing protein [Casimicrobiaceae bacterium]
MGFRFHRSVRLFPGLRLNLSRSGVSASVGRRGAWLTLGRRGVRATVGIPGTGISYSEQSPWARPKPHSPAVPGIEVTELPHVDEIEVPPVLPPRAQNVALAQSAAAPDRGSDMAAAHEQSDDEADPRLLPIALVIAAIVAIVAIGWTFLV